MGIRRMSLDIEKSEGLDTINTARIIRTRKGRGHICAFHVYAGPHPWGYARE